jgi:acetoin utilization deacetylase AcuC-like enzyme
MRHLEQVGLVDACTRPKWDLASDERIAQVHSPEYAEKLRQFSAQGGGRLDADTVASAESYDVARYAAGAVCDAVDRVLVGEDERALCLVRPPGHHALATRAMGFCLLNNIAIAARAAIDDHQLDRVLIVDWDVHHGNGTQDEFWTDEQVSFFSAHRWPFYPGSGAADETGSAAGLGSTLNLPVTMGTSREVYKQAFADELARFADKHQSQLILLSAGFDSHRQDPIGSLGLETEDFAELTAIVTNIAQAHCSGRIVSVLEGGYNPPVLGDCLEVHLRELMKQF